MMRLGDGTFNVKVASRDSDRTKGLSGVNTMSENQGLLMAFPYESDWGIWMKEMNFPIDIVWLNANKEVIYIVDNADPGGSTSIIFRPKHPAKYVVELGAGIANKRSIKVGDKAIFDIKMEEIK